MKKILLFTLSLIIFSCKKEKNNNDKEHKITNEEQVINKHSSKKNLNWDGSYFGITPCASCPGIKNFITLNNNNTYEKVTEFLESDDSPIFENGNFTWSKDKSDITLDDDNKTIFRVSENKLFMLSKDGAMITGELEAHYILKKTEIKNCTDMDDGKGYYLHLFKGNDDITYNILYNTSKKVPTALIQSKELSKELIQTTSWAKGAEYEAEGYKLISKGTETTLFINRKEIKLEPIE